MAAYEPWKIGQMVTPVAKTDMPLWRNRSTSYTQEEMTGRLPDRSIGLVVETYDRGDLGKPDWVRVLSSAGGVGWNRPWNFKVLQ